MTSRSRRLYFAFIALALSSAAGLVAACFPSLDGLTGAAGADATIGADGGPIVLPGSDASSDAGATADVAQGPFCGPSVPQGAFCADFDTLDLPSGFTKGPLKYADASLAVNGDQADSPPRSLVATMSPSSAPSDAGAFAQAFLVYETQLTSSQPREAEVSFSFYLDKAGSPNSAGIYKVLFDSAAPGQFYEVRVNIGSDAKLSVSEFFQGSGAPVFNVPYTAPIAIPTQKWVRIGLKADLEAKIATLTWGGKSTDPIPLTASQSFVPSGSLEMQLGLWFAREPTTGWSLRWDNVLFSPK